MLKKILVDFSHKENVITRYAIIYIKQNGWDNTKQAKSFIFIVVPQQKQYKCSSDQRGKNGNDNNIGDSNKTNKNNNDNLNNSSNNNNYITTFNNKNQ